MPSSVGASDGGAHDHVQATAHCHCRVNRMGKHMACDCKLIHLAMRCLAPECPVLPFPSHLLLLPPPPLPDCSGTKLPEMWLDNFLMVAQWRFPSFSAKMLSILVWSTAMLEHRPSQEWLLCFEQQVRLVGVWEGIGGLSVGYCGWSESAEVLAPQLGQAILEHFPSPAPEWPLSPRCSRTHLHPTHPVAAGPREV